MLNNELLLENLSIQSTTHHIGKYCGSWQGSTYGSGKSSYHIILGGNCWLHQASEPVAVSLSAGDMVFILQDYPFVLSSHSDMHSAVQAPVKKMQGLAYAGESGTDLSCGFITYKNKISQMLLYFLPPTIIFKKKEENSESIIKIIEMINHEAIRLPSPSDKLIISLTELLFFMVIRQYLSRHAIKTPLDNFFMATEFLDLVAEIVLAPANDWTVEHMAKAADMSRSWFTKRFNEVSPLSPAEMVRQIRIALACQHILNGDSLTQSAEKVGYQSQAAFNRVFQRITGVTPGRYIQLKRV